MGLSTPVLHAGSNVYKAVLTRRKRQSALRQNLRCKFGKCRDHLLIVPLVGHVQDQGRCVFMNFGNSFKLQYPSLLPAFLPPVRSRSFSLRDLFRNEYFLFRGDAFERKASKRLRANSAQFDKLGRQQQLPSKCTTHGFDARC